MSRQKDKGVTFLPNSDIKIPKPPKQPDKPLPAYMRYSRKVWESVKTKNPEMKMWDIGKLIGEQWRNLPEDERQGFFAEYEVEKLEYQDLMKGYHNSNAYREWLKAKEKAQSALQEQQMMEKMIGTTMPKEEPRFQLQQIDDDDEEDENCAKNVAANRYHRNHKLIAEIFSESSVPNIKSFVTRPRLENLKRQVQSLMQHQRKLESEIQDMEEKFNVKKKKIFDVTEAFEEKMAELSKPPPPISPKIKTPVLPKEKQSDIQEEKQPTPSTDDSPDTSNEKVDAVVAKDVVDGNVPTVTSDANISTVNDGNAATINNGEVSTIMDGKASTVGDKGEKVDNSLCGQLRMSINAGKNEQQNEDANTNDLPHIDKRPSPDEVFKENVTTEPSTKDAGASETFPPTVSMETNLPPAVSMETNLPPTIPMETNLPPAVPMETSNEPAI